MPNEEIRRLLYIFDNQKERQRLAEELNER
jgi:hypothetical protein